MRFFSLFSICTIAGCGTGGQLPSSHAVERADTEDKHHSHMTMEQKSSRDRDKSPFEPPPAAARHPVFDVYHSVRVEDPYRWMETPSAEFEEWLRAQNDYARRVLNSIPTREALRQELRKANRGIESVEVLRVVGDSPRIFMLRQGAADETPKLVVREGWDGTDKVLLDPLARAVGSSHATIDVAYPSPDGRYVAYVVSMAGGEEGAIEILDVESGRLLADRIDRARLPQISWRSDSRSFFYWRRAKPQPGARVADKYKDSATYLHVFGDSPDAARPVIGTGSSGVGLGRGDATYVVVTPRSRWTLGVGQTGANDWAFFVAPLAAVRPGATRWRRVAATEERVTDIVVHGERLYALTSLDAPNYRVVSFDAKSGSVSDAETFFAESDLVLVTIAGAQDALYVVALDHGVHRLFRVPWRTAVRQEVALPFPGSVGGLVADPTRSGVVFSAEAWTHGPSWYQFDPVRGLRELPITPSSVALEDLVVEQATAVSRDGTEVPLSILRRIDQPLDQSAPALLHGYGAYGLPTNPVFNPLTVVWVQRGGIYANCHVRGSGARGKSWHLSGIKSKKENGVDDFVACSEYLIKKRYTAPDRLTAIGTSAGGILIGGAITKRPELFNAAVLRVPVVNPLRSEERAVGAANTTEYGSVKVESEFHSLLASDPYHRIRPGVNYPAILLTAGLHDPRVPAWQPAKFAARLQASSHRRPVLMRVELEGGHGFGSTQTQFEDEYADIYSFALWQSREASRQPPGGPK